MLTTLTALLLAVPLPPGATPVALPKDGKAVVIEYSAKAGFAVPPKNDNPNLVITADGMVTVNDRFSGQSNSIQLPQAELQGLMHAIVGQKKFFEIDEAKLVQAVKDAQQAAGNFFGIGDAPISTFKIRTADKQHEVKYYALGFHASQTKNVEALQRLAAIEKLLTQVQTIAWAGGEDVVKASLKAANAEMTKIFPKLEPLTADDVNSARKAPDGTVTVYFLRTKSASDTLTLGIEKTADGHKIKSFTRSLTPADYAAYAKDEKAFAKLLDTINAEVQKKFAGFPPVAAADLQTLTWRDGQVNAFFNKRGATPTQFVNVNVTLSATGVPTFIINGSAK